MTPTRLRRFARAHYRAQLADGRPSLYQTIRGARKALGRLLRPTELHEIECGWTEADRYRAEVGL